MMMQKCLWKIHSAKRRFNEFKSENFKLCFFVTSSALSGNFSKPVCTAVTMKGTSGTY